MWYMICSFFKSFFCNEKEETPKVENNIREEVTKKVVQEVITNPITVSHPTSSLRPEPPFPQPTLRRSISQPIPTQNRPYSRIIPAGIHRPNRVAQITREDAFDDAIDTIADVAATVAVASLFNSSNDLSSRRESYGSDCEPSCSYDSDSSDSDDGGDDD